MTARADEEMIIGRIRADDWPRSVRHLDATRAWLRDNGIDPKEVAIRNDVLVVVMDAPVIVFERARRDADGYVLWDRATKEPYYDVVRVPMRVPLPDELNDEHGDGTE